MLTYDRLKLSKEEQAALTTEGKRLQVAGKDMLSMLVDAQIPVPSPGQGWHETTRGPLHDWLDNATGRVLGFVEGLHAWEIGRALLRTPPDRLRASVVAGATERYTEDFQRLAVDVPEFGIWAQLGEHAATRAEVRGAVQEGVATLSLALVRLQETLVAATRRGQERGHRTALARLNAALLDRSVVETDAIQHIDDVRFLTCAAGMSRQRSG
jgi:hypothetical protein